MKKNVTEGTIVHSDGGTSISILNQKMKHAAGEIELGSNGEPIRRYNYFLRNEKFDNTINPLEFVHKFISNLKSMFLGIYHGISILYMDLFIEEFLWRFNHRTDKMNLKRIGNLSSSFFQTSVKTAKRFKQDYANV